MDHRTQPPAAERPAALAATAIRGSEWVLLVFLPYAAADAIAFGLQARLAARIVSLNVAILLGYLLLIGLDARRQSLALSVARDWAPLATLLFIYEEMGWFAHPQTTHRLETLWVRWDRAFLHGGASAVIQSLGPVLPAVLETSYLLVYTIAPFSLAALYLYRRRERAEELVFLVLLGTLLCYGQFPFWPSEPPRTLFAGQDLPAYQTAIRRFNLWILAHAGIHTSVFPSAHVASAFSAAFGMLRALPERRWIGRFLLCMAASIALATIYGRYHYLADAAAGFCMSLVAWGVARLRDGARSG